MPNEIKTLRLGDMIFNRQGSFFRRLVHAIFSLALRLFFRRIETVNITDVPYKGGLIFVMNHPNGLIDPALVFVGLPRRISFLAKSTLFEMPMISWLLRVAEALPVYRKIDSADLSQNEKTFKASHDLLQYGGAIALFPEGVSHNSPNLLPIKTGAARIALGAISGFDDDEVFDLRIVPVGLYYTNKTSFRSEALLHFGTSFHVDAVEFESDGELPRESVLELTAKIEQALKEVTINAESKAKIKIAHEAANLFLSVSETFDLEESLVARSEFIRTYLADDEAEKESELRSEEIAHSVSRYKKKLRKIGLEPENLSLSSQPFWYVFQHFFLRGWVLTFFMPLAIIGTVLHSPAYQIIKLLGKKYSRHGVDEIVSTIKMLSGLVLMPFTWLIFASVLYVYFDWRIALLSLPMSFFCGYVALRSWEEFYDMRGWFKAIWLFFTKRDLFLELLLERRSLHKELKKIHNRI